MPEARLLIPVVAQVLRRFGQVCACREPARLAEIRLDIMCSRTLADWKVAGFLAGLRRTRPFPYPRAMAGSAMALLYFAGGVTGLLTLVFPHPETLNAGVLLLVSLTALPAGAAVCLLRHRLPKGVFPWLLAAGTGIVTLLVGTGGSGSVIVSFSFFYLWVVTYALLFFSPLHAAVQLGLAAVAYGSVLAWVAEPGLTALTALEPITLVAVVATTGRVIMWLSRAREDSEIDPLTLAFNRRGLDRVLSAAVQDAAATGEDLVVGVIDVDHFKSINDLSGHPAGDRVLEDLSRAWQGVLRAGDSLCRLGGDEFVVVLPGCSWSDATAILERLRDAAADTEVTCSMGAALRVPGDSASLLLSRADTALYQAKRLGRDRIAWAAPAG
jgi:diguanylate cyclase (GGDEF)-like protein